MNDICENCEHVLTDMNDQLLCDFPKNDKTVDAFGGRFRMSMPVFAYDSCEHFEPKDNAEKEKGGVK